MTGRLDSARLVHAGPLFEVVRGTLDGQDVAIKRAVAAPAITGDALASDWTQSNVTNIFHTRQLGWTDEGPPLDASYVDALLRAEHVVILNAGGSWNHPGATLARWRDPLGDRRDAGVGLDAGPYRAALGLVTPDILPVDAPGVLCLVMPWCRGDALSALARDDQRRTFPAMMPALWRALAACPHGDLAPDALLLDRSRGLFRILDPGVRIAGPSKPGGLDFESAIVTTNKTHYPLIAPEHGPQPPRVRAPAGGLVARVELERAPYFEHLRHNVAGLLASTASAAIAPSAADVVACGAIYFGILAGRSLAGAFDLDPPLWTGFWSDQGHHPGDHAALGVLGGGGVSRALADTGAGAAEIALCERMILLDVDLALVDRLSALAAAAAR